LGPGVRGDAGSIGTLRARCAPGGARDLIDGRATPMRDAGQPGRGSDGRTTSSRRSTLLWLATMALALSAPCWPARPAATSRDLPPLVERWSRRADEAAILVVGDTVLVGDGTGVAALDVASGAVRWKTSLVIGDVFESLFLRLDDQVAFAAGER